MPLTERKVNLQAVNIRPIEEKDNAALANVIRSTLTEFKANKPGTVYYDSTTDHLFQLFAETPGSIYLVAEHEEEVLGGSGIFPTPGLPPDTCELVKIYLLPHGRGIGLGKALIEKCLGFAREAGYKKVYLESMPELQQALKTYERLGFTYLNGPMGESGHFGCDKWMLLELQAASD
jgi:putative acetyltransferase